MLLNKDINTSTSNIQSLRERERERVIELDLISNTSELI